MIYKSNVLRLILLREVSMEWTAAQPQRHGYALLIQGDIMSMRWK